MTDFFKRLNPNVVFVTLVALTVIGAYVGRQEYLEAKRTVREAECAKQSVWLLGGSLGSGVQADDIISLGTMTSLCIQSGGTVEYQKWAKRGADEKAKAPANEPTDAASPED